MLLVLLLLLYIASSQFHSQLTSRCERSGSIYSQQKNVNLSILLFDIYIYIYIYIYFILEKALVILIKLYDNMVN
jgi:hypothetical protein